MHPRPHRSLACAALPYAAALALFAVPMAAADEATEQRQELSRSFERTITAGAGQRLRIEHSHGDVRITAHPRGELRVHADIRVSGPSQSDAAALLDQIQIEMVESATTVTVRTRYPEQGWWRSRRNVSYAVDYTVSIPEQMPVDVRNSFGAVSATGLKADAVIVNAHGTLSIADTSGRHRLENSFGAIEVARMAGDVTVTGANGDISAATIGGQLNVTNRFGRVTVSAVRGSVLVANSNGQVDVTDAASANVTNSFGPVTVRGVRGNLAVKNANGSVIGATIGGAVSVTGGFGKVDLEDVAGDVTVENANGDVRLANVRGAADVRGSFGRVDAQGLKAGIRVNTANSSVHVADAGGPVFVRTTFGLVAADGIRGALTVDNANGGVQASGITGGADVKTSFGPVVLRDVQGRVAVRNQNGAIEVSAAAKAGGCHDVTLVTSFSPIRIHLPEAGYVVAARTSFGRIHSDVPITATGSIGEGALSGTIGAGGCALQLTNANGDIRILKGNPASR